MLVLLLGEIDLSIGAVSGLAAGVMAVLSVQHGWAPLLGSARRARSGDGDRAVHRVHGHHFGIPSFVVTLAGLLGWQGALLYVLGDTGSVNLPPSIITDLTTTFFDPAVGWAIGIVAIAAYAASLLLARRRRLAAGLEIGPPTGMIVRLVLVSIAILVTIAVLNEDRGVPLAGLIVVLLTVLFTFITERTRYGRHIFAVGGNAEAARRAGIRINRIKISVFTLASTLAAAGGILAASRLLAVNQQSGSGDVLLLAIAGPVIAGHEPVRRPRLRLVGAARGARDRLDLQRHGPAGARLRRQVHDHGRRPARGGDDRRGDRAAPPSGPLISDRDDRRLRFAVGAPNVREYGDPRLLVELGRAAEASGWDGFFVWDHLAYREPGAPVADPWVAIGALAASTERLRLGVLVCGLARRRPWKVARETASLDVLSNGRLVFGAGLGSLAEEEFERFGEEPDARVRAAKLDEGLEIVTGLWSGEPFEHRGEQFTVRETCFRPPPVQRPRIPVWIARPVAGAAAVSPCRALGRGLSDPSRRR